MVIGPSVVMCLSSLLLTTEMEILLKPSLPPSQPFRSQDRPENTQAHVREHFAACDCAPHAERQATNGTGGRQGATVTHVPAHVPSACRLMVCLFRKQLGMKKQHLAPGCSTAVSSLSISVINHCACASHQEV